MASLLKISGRYYVQFYDRTRKPVRKQVPLRTTTKKVAEILARRLDDAYLLGTYDPWNPKPEPDAQPEPDPTRTPLRIPTLGAAVTTFLSAKAHLRFDSLRNYRSCVTRLEQFVGSERTPQSVKESELRAFLEQGTTNDTTKRNYLRHIRVFFRWLVERGDIAHDPTAKIKLRKPPSKFAKYMMPDDMERLCAAIQKDGESMWLIPLVQLTAQLGLRRNEVLNLRWCDVDFDRQCVTVANSEDFTTKTGGERIVPLSRKANEVLTALRAECEGESYVFILRNGRISGSYVTHRFSHYRKLAGLPSHITFHSLRHTAASWLVMNGASLEAVRMFLGHSDIQMTQRYAHLAPNVYFRQVTDALNV